MDVLKKMQLGGIIALCAIFSSQAQHNVNTDGQCGISRTNSAYTSGLGSFNIGITGKGEYDPKFVFNTDANNNKINEEVAMLFSEGIFACFGVSNTFDFNIGIPVYEDVWSAESRNAVGIGDLAVGVKSAHPGLGPNAPFRVAYLFRVSFPTGSDSGFFQRHSYYTQGNQTANNRAFTFGGIQLNPMMVWTLDWTKTRWNAPLLLHGNFGAYSGIDDTRSNYDGYGFLGNLAFEYLVNKNFSTYIELYGESRMLNYLYGRGFSLRHFNNDALLASIGGNCKFKGGGFLDFSFTYALTDNDYRRAEWIKTDASNTKYYYSTAQAAQYGFSLTLGLARIGKKADTDGDRIPNAIDKCPDQPEDYDGYQDDDGCPDLVHELTKDTVILEKKIVSTDTLVRHDTVRIEEPKPNTIIDYGVIVLQAVNFATGRAELKSSSNQVLNDIATSLVKYPQVRLEIRGYCDNTGSDQINKRLSTDRALAVANYLIKQGIDRNRLQCVGMGSADPVGDNATPDGRMQNRRVELKRID
jgi:outer membrane protein OmpA-like peptidoglycan-associated protein